MERGARGRAELARARAAVAEPHATPAPRAQVHGKKKPEGEDEGPGITMQAPAYLPS